MTPPQGPPQTTQSFLAAIKACQYPGRESIATDIATNILASFSSPSPTASLNPGARVFLLAGPSGVGTSFLLEAIRARLTPQHPAVLVHDCRTSSENLTSILVSHCSQGSARFGALKDLAFTVATTANERPIVLLLDNVHCADADVTELVSSMLSFSGVPHSLDLVATATTALESRQASQLLATLRNRRDCVQHHIQCLSREELERLLASLGITSALALAHFLHTETSGLPLLVARTLHDLVSDGVIVFDGAMPICLEHRLTSVFVPASVAAYAATTLARAPAHCSSLLDHLAASTLSLSPPSLAALTSRSPASVADDLALLASRGVLTQIDTPHARTYLLAHSSFRRHHLDSLPHDRVQAVHRRLAEHFRSLGDQEPIVEAVAHHYIAALDHTNGPQYAFKAADLAMKSLSHNKALALYKAGVDLLPSSAHDDRLSALSRIANILVLQGRLAHAADYYSEILILAKRCSNKNYEHKAIVELAFLHVERGDLERAVSYAKAAQDETQYPGVTSAKAKAMVIQAQALRRVGHLDESSAVVQSALRLAIKASDPYVSSYCRSIQGLIETDRGNHREALSYFKAAHDIKSALDDTSGILLGLNNIGLVNLELGSLAEAEAHFNKALDEARVHGLSLVAMLASINMSEVNRHRGNSPEALSHARSAIDIAEASHRLQFLPYFYYSFALCHLDVGRYDEGLLALLKAESHSLQFSIHVDTCLARAGLARLWALCGDMPKATHYASLALETARRLGFKQALVIASNAAASSQMSPDLWRPMLDTEAAVKELPPDCAGETAFSLISIRCQELLADGSLQACVELSRRWSRIALDHGRKPSAVRMLHVEGQCLLRMKQYQASRSILTRAAALARSAGMVPALIGVYELLISATASSGDTRGAAVQERELAEALRKVGDGLQDADLRSTFLRHHGRWLSRGSPAHREDGNPEPAAVTGTPLIDVLRDCLRDAAASLGADSAVLVLADNWECVVSCRDGSIPASLQRGSLRNSLLRGERASASEPGGGGWLFQPVRHESIVFGALCFSRRASAPGWTDENARPLDTCSSAIESAVAEWSKAFDGNRRGATHDSAPQHHELVFTSRSMGLLGDRIRSVAAADCNVLLLGESGSGKEIVARAIHSSGRRKDRPFIPLDCGAVPEGLVESELFGYQRGAFSGAELDKRGVMEESDGGTLFLDEITNASMGFQAKLLRTIQSGEFRRLGDTGYRHVDSRIIAATNADIEALVKQGRFRDDLYYRLNVVTLRIPPLRERVEDIPLLARHFARRFCQARGWHFKGIAAGAMARLRVYGWPGNVRELEHAIEAALVVTGDGIVRRDALPEKIKGSVVDEVRDLLDADCGSPGESIQQVAATGAGVDAVMGEQEIVLDALRRSGGEKSAAARLLGWNRMRLYRALRRHGIPYK